MTVAPAADPRATAQRDGFHIARGLFTPAEVAALIARMTALHDRAPLAWYTTDPGSSDPLARWPRMMHPHRHDELALRTLLAPRVLAIVRALIGEEPLAAQSMLYFKPPGARGQGWHQDDYYLRSSPGGCWAAWLALDDVEPENGGLSIERGSHRRPLLCPERGEVDAYGNLLVEPTDTVPVVMRAGDCLFFDGRVVHGSGANRSATRWRRSFICHYVARSTAAIGDFYDPVIDADGARVPLRLVSKQGSPCGGG